MSNKKRVLIIAQHGLNKGGIQTVIMSIVRTLSEQYVFDIIVFSKDKRFYEEEFSNYGGKIFRIEHKTSADGVMGRIQIYYRWFKDYYAIKKIIKENGPYCAIHCNNEFESCVALSAGRKENINIRIAHAHVLRQKSSRPIRRLFDWAQQKIMLKNGNVFVGCSEKACQMLFTSKTEYLIIPNSFNDKDFDKHKFKNYEVSEPKLIQIGNYSDLKNQLFSLEVFKGIKDSYPRAEIKFVGFDVGGYEAKIKQRIKELNLEKNVVLYPSDADIPKLLAESSYLLLPSRTEAFGIVLLEAQSMGLKCFVSDIVPRISNAGGCKYLSIDINPAVWTQAILEDFAKTGGIHHDFDCSKFSDTEIANIYAKVYERKVNICKK